MKGAHSVRLLCQVLGVARSGYCRWLRQWPGKRKVQDAQLAGQIATAHRRVEVAVSTEHRAW